MRSGVSRVRVSRVSIRVKVRFMVWVRGNVWEGKCRTLLGTRLSFNLVNV